MSNAIDLVREMRDALEYLRSEVSTYWRNPSVGPTHPKFFDPAMFKASSAIIKADAYLKEGAAEVKYGCHYLGGMFIDCTAECVMIKHRKCSGKDDCKYWKPIKESGHE